jgi:predicted ATPase/class 3 adenylate cyclase
LTCLFCDLANSVELSERTDPEDLREILAAYQLACARVVRRFEGHIARYFGDGILVYFGFPQAHEDEAQRAVRSGVGIREAVQQLSAQLEREHNVRLHVRIAIHTGVVVAGDIAPGEQLETQAAIGDTPNIAARLQALADPDSVLISSATYRLITGYFHCREVGFRSLRGISSPMAVYEVLNESGARNRLDIVALGGLAPLAGRDSELERLRNEWQAALGGAARSLLILGEPGIGKSRLVRALQEQAAQAPDAVIVRLTCSAYFQNTAFHPAVEFLQSALQLTPDATPDACLDRLEGFLTQYGLTAPEYAPLLAELLAVPSEHRYPTLQIPPTRRRRLLMNALTDIVLLRAGQQPLLLIMEDLHWSDPSTLELLVELLGQTADARLLLVLTSRDDVAIDARTPRLRLNRLDPDASRAIVDHTAGQNLPDQIVGQVLRKADGVPLYLEELTRFVVDTGLLRDDDGLHFSYDRNSAPISIPSSLADSLNARLDQQSGSKRVAQLGATIGREFSYELLATVLRRVGRLNEARLRRDLAHLVDADLLTTDPDTPRLTYRFKHALIRDSAYASLLKRTRQKYHRFIAETLISPTRVIAEPVPELVAHHYTQAGMLQEAVPWWLRAGQRALGGSAYQEAIAHLTAGLEVVAQMPEGISRSGVELELRLTLGPAYMATYGYGARIVEECYQRARDLCRDLGNPPKLAPVVYGLWSYHIVRAQHHTALELGQQIVALGEAVDSPALRVQGALAVGWSQMFLGRFESARANLNRALELYDVEQQPMHAYMVDDPATSAASCLGLVEWFLGYQDRARRIRQETLERLRTARNPYNVAFGLMVNGFLSVAFEDFDLTRELASRTIELSDRHGLVLTGSMGMILDGYAQVRTGEIEAGIANMHQALARYAMTGAELALPYWHWLLADAAERNEAHEVALAQLAECEAVMRKTNEVYFEPELHRLRGEILQRAGGNDPVAAQRSLQRAIAIAAETDSRCFELKARLALARIYVSEHREKEAHSILAESYAFFTEGLDWADLREAGTLLNDLGDRDRVYTSAGRKRA